MSTCGGLFAILSIFSKTLFLKEEILPACLPLGNPLPPLGAEGGCSVLGKVNGRRVERR